VFKKTKNCTFSKKKLQKVQNPCSLQPPYFTILVLRVWARKHRGLQKKALKKKSRQNSWRILQSFTKNLHLQILAATKLSLSHHPLFFAQIPRFVVVDAILLAGATSGAEAAAGF
jgi:long-subunit acyl-CoA synthetase (AMP-forming)